jgi:ribonuclease III
MEPPQLAIGAVEEIVGTRIRNLSLYQTAFTHKSALKQYSVKSSYETLEFLGDAVLSFVITKHLFDTYSSEQEGFLTKARTKLVRGKTLFEISKRLGLDRYILMDDKGMRNEWFRNPKIMEDVLEALIGAIYLDLGICHVKQFVQRYILSSPVDVDLDDNYKDIVMRWCQASKFPLPVYSVHEYTDGVFRVALFINGAYVSHGSATTKKDAEQGAAREFVRNNGCLIPNGSKGSEAYRPGVPCAEV